MKTNEIDKAYLQGAKIAREGSAVVDVDLGSEEVWNALLAGYNENTRPDESEGIWCIQCNTKPIEDIPGWLACYCVSREIHDDVIYPLIWRVE